MRVPETMTAIVLRGAGGPEVLVPEARPVPRPGPGEVLIEVRGRRRQPARRPAAHGRLSAAARRLGPARASRSPARSRRWARASTRLARRRRRLRAGRRRRLCRICRGARTQRLPVPAGPTDGRGRGAPGDLLHRLEQRLRARRPAGRRDACSSMAARQRHRHHRDPARARPSAPRSSPPPARRRSAPPAQSSAPTAPSTTASEDFVAAVKAATGGRGRRRDPRHGRRRLHRPQSTRPPPIDGRIVQIAFLTGRRPRSTCSRLMVKRLTITGSTLRPRTVADKAAIAARAGGQGLAAAGRRPRPPADRHHLPAGEGGGGAPAHGASLISARSS